MPPDLESIADPRFILLAWAAGLAFVAAGVTLRRIVGPGFTWLAASTAALIGLPGAIAGGAWAARVGLVLLAIALALGRRPDLAGWILLGAGAAYLVETSATAGVIPAITGTLALGGVSGEMLLGHWYLVDPRLPRAVLGTLAGVGITGLLAEAALHLGLTGVFGGGGEVGFWVLLVASVVLMVAVIGALRYPAYSGVMAATGLSYLSLLTTLGAVFVGRAVVAGLGPFHLG